MDSQYILRSLCIVLLALPAPVLAFPDTPILDTFTGSDNTSPPNSNWTNSEIRDGAAGCDLEDNAVTASATGGYNGCYWHVQTFGPASEAYATIVNIGSTGFGAVCTRIANPGNNTTDGYCVEWADATSQIFIVRLDNAVVTTLSTISQAITTTDKIGIKVVGNQICAWFSDSGGAWTEKGCASDSTYTAAGYIGLYINGSATVGGMDDFGGGTVSEISQMKRRLTQ